MKAGTGALFVSSAAILSLTGCIDTNKDLFDAEQTKEIYESGFPVSNIDPSMDWKTTQSTNISVTVEEDAGTDYRVRLFDDYPLAEGTSAKLLADGYARKGEPFISSFDCPIALEGVYILRTDEYNRHLIKYVEVNNGAVETTFGETKISTRAAATRGGESAYTIPTYTPQKSEADAKAMISGAIKITGDTNFEAGKAYYVAAGETVTLTSGFGVNNQTTSLVVAGTLIINANEQQAQAGTDIYVISGGKIQLGDNKFTLNQANIYIYGGGEISGNELSINANNKYNYNAGKMTLTKISDNGGTLYNSNTGVINLGEADFTNYGSTIYNFGEASITSCHPNITIQNASKLTITTFVGKLINTGKVEIGNTNDDNNNIENYCYVKIDGNYYGSLSTSANTTINIDGDLSSKWGQSVSLGENSMLIVAQSADLEGRTVTGPSNGHALFRMDYLKGINSFNTSGNVYYEVNTINSNLNDAIAEYSWGWGYLRSTYLKLSQDGATVAKWNESPFILPDGDCTGLGNAQKDEGEDIELNPMNYTYAFEDNYPRVGDYDFNDIVLNVSTEYDREKSSNAIKRIQYNVTLSAIGATKKIGAGLRLVGIDKSAVASVSFGGRTAMRNTLAGSVFENADTESSDKDIVIPLFGDAHAVYGISYSTMANTGKYDLDKTYTLEVIITLSNQTSTTPLITKDNLDFFIATLTTGSEKRTEVHLYEFRDSGATDKGTVHDLNLEVAGNKTWAISVPEFKYPCENIKITEAYPDFSKWAQGRESNETWYLNPTNKTDRKYIY